jgi:membrane-bound lytic murein transglycosylase F
MIFMLKICTNSDINHVDDTYSTCTDLMQIQNRNRLDVSIANNSINYYILQGHPYGFQYEMISSFADYLDVELNIQLTNNIEENIHNLQSETIDIYCADLTVITDRFGKDIVFTMPIMSSSHVLIKRKQPKQITSCISETDTSTKIIYVPKNSIYKSLINSQRSLFALAPVIIEVPNYGSEQLIDAVSEGFIDYTIADYHLARMKSKLLHNIDYSTEIYGNLPLAWAVRACSKQLVDTINNWLTDYITSQEYKFLYHRYISGQFVSKKRTNEFFSNNSNKISQYDAVIKKESKTIDWDWRLVSALIYEESHFRHDLYSTKGAYGIMQFMPHTAERFGVNEESSAEEHIVAGIKYIRHIENFFIESVPDKNERIKFVIASYNIGAGHILDAMALAEKHRRNPSIWDNNTSYFLQMKKHHEYYSDEVVKNGYLNAKSTIQFVKKVLDRYEHFKNMYKE